MFLMFVLSSNAVEKEILSWPVADVTEIIDSDPSQARGGFFVKCFNDLLDS